MSVTLTPIGGSTPDTISDADFIAALAQLNSVMLDNNRVIVVNGKQYLISTFSGWGGGGGAFPNQQVISLGSIDYTQLNAAPITPHYPTGFPYVQPAGKIVLRYIAKVTVPFVAGTSGNLFGFSDVCTLDAIGNAFFLPFGGYEADVIGFMNNVFFKYIDPSGFTIPNPQGWTAGACDCYAVIADSPV